MVKEILIILIKMFDILPKAKAVFSKLGSLADSNVTEAFLEAFEKARESKNTGLLEKITIFAKQFYKEITEVEEAKEAVSKETSEETLKIVEKTKEQVKKEDKLPEDVKDQELDLYVQAKGFLMTAANESGKKARSGLAKLREAVDGKRVSPLELSEAFSLGGMGLLTIGKLKKEFTSEGDLAKALKKVLELSNASATPLQNLMNADVVKMLKPKSGGFTHAAKLARICNDFHIGYLDALSFGKDYMDMPQAEKAVALKNFILENKKHFFPYTSRKKVIVALATIRKMKGGKFSPDLIAKLAFQVDDRDRERLIGLLTGKKNTSLKRVA